MLDKDRLIAIFRTLPRTDQVRLAVQAGQLAVNEPLTLPDGRMLHFANWRAWGARWEENQDRSARAAAAAAEIIPPDSGIAEVARAAALAARALADGEDADVAFYGERALYTAMQNAAPGDDVYRLLEQTAA